MIEWFRLHPLEKWLTIRHPWATFHIRRLAHRAWEEELRRFPGPSSMDLDGPGDAFRHCYWSALIARSFGAQLAKEVTDAHEHLQNVDLHVMQSHEGFFGRDIHPASRMDLHNNQVGIELGLRWSMATEEELADRCEEAVRSGRCIVLLPRP